MNRKIGALLAGLVMMVPTAGSLPVGLDDDPVGPLTPFAPVDGSDVAATVVADTDRTATTTSSAHQAAVAVQPRPTLVTTTTTSFQHDWPGLAPLEEVLADRGLVGEGPVVTADVSGSPPRSAIVPSPSPDGAAADAIPDVRVPLSSHRDPHPPIVIRGDRGPQGFYLVEDPVTGDPVPRPGSGVRGGSGTPDDPFVIEDWAVPSISIRGTTAHVVVRDNRIGPVAPAWTGRPPVRVDVADAANVTIEANVVQAQSGFGVEQAAIVVEDAAAVTIDGNAISDASTGIGVSRSLDVAVVGNDLEVRSVALWLEAAPSIVVSGNSVESGYFGVFARDSPGASVESNVVGAVSTALSVVASNGTRVAHNALSGNLFLVDSTDGVWSANVQTAGEHAEFIDAPHATLRDNRFTKAGLTLLASSLDGYVHDIDGSNNAGGAPIAYLLNATGALPTTGAGQVIAAGGHDLSLVGGSFEGPAAPVTVAYSRNVSVEDVTVRNASYGVLVDGAEDVRVTNLSATGDGTGAHLGALVVETTGFVLEGASVDGANILVGRSAGPVLASNRIADGRIRLTDNAGGTLLDTEAFRANVRLHACDGLTASGNVFDAGGFELSGSGPEDFRCSIDTTNTVNGSPVRFYHNATEVHVPPDTGQVLAVNSGRIVVEDVELGPTAFAVDVNFVDELLVANVTVSDSTGGVIAMDVGSVSVQDVDLAAEYGIIVNRARLVHVDRAGIATGLQGLLVYQADNATVLATTIETEVFSTLALNDVDHARIAAVDLTGMNDGIILSDAGAGALIDRATVRAADIGVVAHGTGPRLRVSNASVEAGNTGFAAVEMVDVTVVDSTFRGGLTGVFLGASTPAEIVRNNISDNEIGIHVQDRTYGITIRDNNIWNHSFAGLFMFQLTPDARERLYPIVDVDASENWWDCPFGPAAPDCDEVKGTPRFVPWRTAPNPEAGA